MVPGGAEARSLGKSYWLFAIAFAVLLVVLAMLGQLGLPDRATGVIVIAVTAVTYVAIGLVAGTMRLADFFAAGRIVPAGLNGLATAAAFISGSAFLGLAGAFFAAGNSALALVIGWSFGFLVLAVAVAPYFRKSGALTLPDFFAIRFGGPLIRLAGVVVLLGSCFFALAAALATAGLVASVTLGMSLESAILAAVVVVLLSSLLGGMRGVTLVSGAQAIVILFAVLAPVAILSARDYGLPLPQLTYGYALQEIAADPSGGPPALVGAASRLLPFGAVDAIDFLGIVLCLAAGVASLPHVLVRSAAAAGPHDARRSAGWALVVVLAVLLTAPAYAAFARLAILNDVIGASPDDIPDWLLAFGHLGLVRICGVDAVAIEALKTVCTVVGGGPTINSVAVASDAVALTLPGMADLPYVATALIAAGGIAAALAAANALLVAIANSVSHDLYGSILHRRAPIGRKLVVARLVLILTAGLAAWFALNRPDDSFALAAVSLAIAAAGNFPALVLGIWWRRTTASGALAGIVAGLAVALGVVALTRYGSGVIGLPAAGVPAAAAATLGIPVGFVAAIAVSLVTRQPSEPRGEIIDAIRRPTADQLLEHAQS